MEALSVDDLPNKSQIFNKLSTLPPAEFNGILQGLMNDTEQARRAIRDIASDVRRELGEESLDQATSQFRDSGDDEGPTPPPDEDDEDPVLKGLLGGKDKPEEQPEVEEFDNPEGWSERELKSGIDDALDSGDYDTVRMLTDILNKKY
jgi:hypothetical protein